MISCKPLLVNSIYILASMYTLVPGPVSAHKVLICHRYDFLVCLNGTDLLFSNFFYYYSSLGIDHDPPCSLCSHD